MRTEELKEIIEKAEYECYGIRVDYDRIYRVGDTCENSHQWWQDDPEDGSEYNEDMQAWDGGELPGTCALRVNNPDNLEEVVKKSKMYPGAEVTLIAGDVFEGGNDIGEVIIESAKVLAVLF